MWLDVPLSRSPGLLAESSKGRWRRDDPRSRVQKRQPGRAGVPKKLAGKLHGSTPEQPKRRRPVTTNGGRLVGLPLTTGGLPSLTLAPSLSHAIEPLQVREPTRPSGFPQACRAGSAYEAALRQWPRPQATRARCRKMVSWHARRCARGNLASAEG